MLLNLTLLDWILLLVMVLYAIGGYSRGFFLTLGSVVGFALGAVAAFYLTPLVVSMVGGGWRILVAVLSVVGLIGLGQALG
ncbi:serine protease, partial [Staphylococcus sp. EG-SA-29]|nr:serine protease [Staphylococcus sp. EG-SA-29]